MGIKMFRLPQIRDKNFPTVDEIVAVCKAFVGDKWWPDDAWLWIPSFAFNLVTNDVTHEEYIVVYPMQNGEPISSMGVHITVKAGKEGH